MSERQPKAAANDTKQPTTPCEAPANFRYSLFIFHSPARAPSLFAPQKDGRRVRVSPFHFDVHKEKASRKNP